MSFDSKSYAHPRIDSDWDRWEQQIRTRCEVERFRSSALRWLAALKFIDCNHDRKVSGINIAKMYLYQITITDVVI